MYELKVKTFPADDTQLQEILRKLEAKNYKIEQLVFIGYTTTVERLWTVVYRKKD